MVDRPNLLVTGAPPKDRLEALAPHASLVWLDELKGGELDAALPLVDCILVQTWWPEALTPERVAEMSRLRFVQSGMAGVNHIPFKHLGKRVTVCSNAGGFSVGVAEFAMTLVMAAAKRVVTLDRSMRSGEFDPARVGTLFREVVILRGRTLGVLGYGGIGKAVGSIASALGMNVVAYSRSGKADRVQVLSGSEGLTRVLGTSDAVVVALPLSKLTVGLVGRPELGAMKRDAVLVNVARAEIVDEEAVYEHLVRNPGFTYATDVWQIVRGKETYSSKFPFLKLRNFIGTPHVAGGSAALTGEPLKAAVENLSRYLKGETPQNVVDPSEYI
ncbi:MAG: hydroxyacid dehydrogenase [Nitrososphaerota archaeon]|nr:hydroxyacid dehydrogenase [Nitrososphaerota archaeon]MDG7021003.1 hydroxyacid dehydrogenase [Nitrososphaerota archaeon]